jgi:hypothetical protein
MNLEQVDKWVLGQMDVADKLITRAEKAIIKFCDAPETQDLILKIPRWLPFHSVLRTHVCPPGRRQQRHAVFTKRTTASPRTINFECDPQSMKAREISGLAPPNECDCYSPHTQPVQGPKFSRMAVAKNPKASAGSVPIRVYDDNTFTQLQASPFSRRKAASKSSAYQRMFDEESLALLLGDDDTLAHGEEPRNSKDGDGKRSVSRTASAASTNLHTSPPTEDLFSSFNPVIPSLHSTFLHSVGNLFDTNPVPAAARSRA